MKVITPLGTLAQAVDRSSAIKWGVDDTLNSVSLPLKLDMRVYVEEWEYMIKTARTIANQYYTGQLAPKGHSIV